MKELWELFIVFAKIGGFTFGGGYAMLPILQREVVENRNWATSEELMDYYAIGQCTPGIISVNTATFIGQKTRGNIGGIFATLGVVFPSTVIINILAGIITTIDDLPAVQNAFGGIRVCVCVLIFNAICKLWKGAIKGPLSIGIFLVVALGSYFLNISPAIFVVAAGLIGIVLELTGARKSTDAKASDSVSSDKKGGDQA